MVEMRSIAPILVAAALSIIAPNTAMATGDVAAGEKLFKRCKACHYVDKDLNKTGPSLLGVIGRTAGGYENYKKYSAAMTAAGDDGLVWDEASLTEFLRKPRTFIKGTKMAFGGFKKDDQLADIIAYLKSATE